MPIKGNSPCRCTYRYHRSGHLRDLGPEAGVIFYIRVVYCGARNWETMDKI